MDRRKLRRLLASSSFIAILAGANQAGAQALDLTNPAGSTTSFLRVEPGQTFDDVINDGLITNNVGEAGIRVRGTGTVQGEIRNRGDIVITDDTSAIGILITESGATIANGIVNEGLIDIDVVGSGANLFAAGISIAGKSNIVGTSNAEHGIFNTADGTIDVRVHSFKDTGGVTAIADVGGAATGIYLAGTNTLHGGVTNFGLIDVNVTDTAIARGQGAAAVKATAVVNGTAWGLDINGDTLAGGFHNNGTGNGPQDGNGEILVTVVDKASALSFTQGTGNRKAEAKATATGSAFGGELNFDDITVEIYHDGIIDVDVSQNALGKATATGEGKAEATAQAFAKATAQGLTVDANALYDPSGEEGGYEGHGEIFADAHAVANALANANSTGTGDGKAKAKATNIFAEVTGLILDIDSIGGGFANDGLIDVGALAVARATADVDVVNGKAEAEAIAEVSQAGAHGLIVSVTTLDNGFRNNADVLANATATGVAQALASSLAGKADAKAKVSAVYALATGVSVDISTVTGNFLNGGTVSAFATAEVYVNASAVAHGAGNAANAKGTAIGGSANANGALISLDTVNGSVTNSADVDAKAYVRGDGLDFTSLRVFASGQEAKAEGKATGATATATGVSIGFDTISGDLSNAGNIHVTAQVDVLAIVSAKAGSKAAEAKFAADNFSANATGLTLSGSTVDGDVNNSGDITAHALVNFEADVRAVATDDKAAAKGTVVGGSAYATGISLSIDTVFGSIKNSGDVYAAATVDAGDSLRVFASGSKADAKAVWKSAGSAQATALYVSVDTVGGDFRNEGNLTAVARFDAHVDATAKGETEAKAAAQFTGALSFVTAVELGITTVDGNFSHEGDVHGTAAMTVDVFASASATNGAAKATAKAAALSVYAYSNYNSVTYVGGSVNNSGDVVAIARLNAAGTEDGVRAVAKGDEAKAQATLSAVTYVWVEGYYVGFTSIGGDLENSGDVTAIASADILVQATAEAGTGKAEAKAKLFDLTSVTISAGVTYSGDTVGGSVINDGKVYASAILHAQVSASAQSTGDKADAKAEVGQIIVGGAAVEISIGTVFGSFENNGDITMLARFDGGDTIRGFASGTEAKAEVKAKSISATGSGLYLSLSSINGDVVNNGNVWVSATIDLHGSAVALAKGGKAEANAKVEDLSATGTGVYFSIGTANATVQNDGDVVARAVIHLDLDASAKSTGSGAKAKAEAKTIQASATGVYFSITSANGSVINSGAVTATAWLDAGSSVDVDATGTTAKAEAKVNAIDMTATGVEFSISTANSDVVNQGAVNALAKVDLRIDAHAIATTGVGEAKASLDDVNVTAVGVFATINTVNGSFRNEGDVHASALATLAVLAGVTADDSSAKAKASVGAKSSNALQAHGVELQIDTILGSAINSGNVTAIAKIDASGENGVRAFASASSKAEAEAKFQDLDFLEATALLVDGFTSIGGNVENSGSLNALASAVLHVGAQAIADDAKAKATVGDVQVSAAGFSVDGSSIGGNLINSGAIHANALLSLDVTGSATGTKAKAEIGAKELTVTAVGMNVDVDTVFGSVSNSGDVAALAQIRGVDVTSSGTVIGTAAFRAFASGSDVKASAKVEKATASATGLFFEIDTLSGDLLNQGAVVALAQITLDIRASATATNGGKAEAEAKANKLLASASGIEMDGTSLGGSFRNSGDVQVSAAIDLFVSAAVTGTTNSVTAKAKAEVNELKALAAGISLGVDTIVGGAINSGSLLVRADIEVTASVTPEGSVEDGKAKIGKVEASAVGFGVFASSIGGGILNNGTIMAIASIDIIARATLGSDTAKATADGAKAKATGLLAKDFGVLNGGFDNSGKIVVLADVFADAHATGTNTAEAKADAKAEAAGMVAKGDTLSGGVSNAGTIIVDAIAVASASDNFNNSSAKAEAKAVGLSVEVNSLFGDVFNDGLIDVGAKATASASTTKANAEAFGILVNAKAFASASVINAGTIFVAATADSPAKAIGMAIKGDGVYTGALMNTSEAHIVVRASDPAKATAIGMTIDGKADVEGGIINAGTITVEAVTTGSPISRAIDLSKSKGTGHLVQMLDGSLEATTRSTANAEAGPGGAAVYMAENGKADQLDWSGGLVLADIVGDQASDNLDVFAGVDNVLNMSDTIDGLVAIDVNNATHAVTEIEFRINALVTRVSFLNVNENGTLVVGNDANINVNTANFDEQGRVLFEIGPGTNNNGVIHANTANLGGTIGIRSLAGLYNDTDSYLVIDANLNGTFDNTEIPDSPLLSLSVEQTSPDVVLTVTRNAFASVPGLTHNQNELGEAIDDFYDPVALAGSEIGEVVIGELFTLNTDELLDAYDDLHGAEYAQMAYAGFEQMQFMQGGISQRLQDARTRTGGAGQSASLSDQSLQYAAIGADEGIQGTQMASIGNDPDHPGSVWGKGYGSWGTLDGDDEAPGYDRTTGSIVVGLDYRFDSDFLVGIAGAYSFSNMDFDDGDNGDIDSFQIGLFGSWDSGTWYVDGMVSYAFQSYDTERNINFGTIDEKAKADYNGGAAQVYGEVGYQFQVGEQALITPLLGLGWTGVWTEDFKEKGANGANLSIDDASYDSLATTLGVRGSLSLGGFEPSLFLGWRHEFLDDHGEADVAFTAVPDSQWQVIGSDVGSDAGLVGIGLVAEISDQFEVMADYSGQFSGSGSSNTGSIGLKFKF